MSSWRGPGCGLCPHPETPSGGWTDVRVSSTCVWAQSQVTKPFPVEAPGFPLWDRHPSGPRLALSHTVPRPLWTLRDEKAHRWHTARGDLSRSLRGSGQTAGGSTGRPHLHNISPRKTGSLAGGSGAGADGEGGGTSGQLPPTQACHNPLQYLRLRNATVNYTSVHHHREETQAREDG